MNTSIRTSLALFGALVCAASATVYRPGLMQYRYDCASNATADFNKDFSTIASDKVDRTYGCIMGNRSFGNGGSGGTKSDVSESATGTRWWWDGNTTYAYVGEIWLNAGKTNCFWGNFDDGSALFIGDLPTPVFNQGSGSGFSGKAAVGTFTAPASGWYAFRGFVWDWSGGKNICQGALAALQWNTSGYTGQDGSPSWLKFTCDNSMTFLRTATDESFMTVGKLDVDGNDALVNVSFADVTAEATLRAYYGALDGGTTPAAWDGYVDLATVSAGDTAETTYTIPGGRNYAAIRLCLVRDTDDAFYEFSDLIEFTQTAPAVALTSAEPDHVQISGSVQLAKFGISGSSVTLGVEVSDTEDFASILDSATISASITSVGSYDYAVTGLAPNTDYYVRAVAENNLGVRGVSAPVAVKTLSAFVAPGIAAYSFTADGLSVTVALTELYLSSATIDLYVDNVLAGTRTVSATGNVPFLVSGRKTDARLRAVITAGTDSQSYTADARVGSSMQIIDSAAGHDSVTGAIVLGVGDAVVLPPVSGDAYYRNLDDHRFLKLDGTCVTALEPGMGAVEYYGPNGQLASTVVFLIRPEMQEGGRMFVYSDAINRGWGDASSWYQVGVSENSAVPDNAKDVAFIPVLSNGGELTVSVGGTFTVQDLYIGRPKNDARNFRIQGSKAEGCGLVVTGAPVGRTAYRPGAVWSLIRDADASMTLAGYRSADLDANKGAGYYSMGNGHGYGGPDGAQGNMIPGRELRLEGGYLYDIGFNKTWTGWAAHTNHAERLVVADGFSAITIEPQRRQDEDPRRGPHGHHHLRRPHPVLQRHLHRHAVGRRGQRQRRVRKHGIRLRDLERLEQAQPDLGDTHGAVRLRAGLLRPPPARGRPDGHRRVPPHQRRHDLPRLARRLRRLHDRRPRDARRRRCQPRPQAAEHPPRPRPRPLAGVPRRAWSQDQPLRRLRAGHLPAPLHRRRKHAARHLRLLRILRRVHRRRALLRHGRPPRPPRRPPPADDSDLPLDRHRPIGREAGMAFALPASFFAYCPQRLPLELFQTAGIEKKVQEADVPDAVVVAIGCRVLSVNDHFLEVVAGVLEREGLLCHLFLVGNHPGGLDVDPLIAAVHDEVDFVGAENVPAALLPVETDDTYINGIPIAEKFVVDGIFHQMREFYLAETCTGVTQTRISGVVFGGIVQIVFAFDVKARRLADEKGIGQVIKMLGHGRLGAGEALTGLEKMDELCRICKSADHAHDGIGNHGEGGIAVKFVAFHQIPQIDGGVKSVQVGLLLFRTCQRETFRHASVGEIFH